MKFRNIVFMFVLGLLFNHVRNSKKIVRGPIYWGTGNVAKG